MASPSITVAAPLSTDAADVRRGVPWYIWNFAAAVFSVAVGGIWDIIWHASIGRDTFWTPAHIAIYLCGVLGGIGSAVLILRTTFDKAAPLRDVSVSMWGFRGPLGAFVAAWGGVAMLVSAPFDDWWHNAYGLDVKVLSPPHTLLILGIMAIKLGALLITLGEMNRAKGRERAVLSGFFLFVGALFARDLPGIFTFEHLFRTLGHSARFYLVAAITIPIGFVAVARAMGGRWPLTKLAGLVTVISLAILWIFPLFPAEPKLGPVYQKIDHMMPIGGFPLLILIPFVLMDWLAPRLERLGDWRRALVLGGVFFAVFLAVQWPFSTFLLSEGARNWFFGSHYMPYFTHPESDLANYRFTEIEATAAQFWTRMGLAAAFAVLSTRAGLGFGRWMTSVKR